MGFALNIMLPISHRADFSARESAFSIDEETDRGIQFLGCHRSHCLGRMIPLTPTLKQEQPHQLIEVDVGVVLPQAAD